MALDEPPPPPPDDEPELPQAPSTGPAAASPATPASPLSRPRRPTFAWVSDRGAELSDMAPPVTKLVSVGVPHTESPRVPHVGTFLSTAALARMSRVLRAILFDIV